MANPDDNHDLRMEAGQVMLTALDALDDETIGQLESVAEELNNLRIMLLAKGLDNLTIAHVLNGLVLSFILEVQR